MLTPSEQNPRVTARSLSKWYWTESSYRTSLQESFKRAWRHWCGRSTFEEPLPTEGRQGPEKNTLWAVRDLTFEIQPGECLGVIGSNGAGKSTLVRLLARLTDPSAGEAIVQGKIASVLEVGSGFHPDLTAPENALLNGVFLGMRRVEVEERMEAILNFSELQDFKTMPVKKLSQGMQYRLALAVALHANADFLLLDEVLEVADREFENKCWERIQHQRERGVSFLFVSHNLDQVKRFCSRLLWMDEGRIHLQGEPQEVLEAYTL
ncbi:ABC transporter ATP-binding protein [bacterium]|nr:ABC transporter ATP-binding protein [bacterium]NBX82394.1 ABC transporter ATP-binding protein [bacterium]